MGIINILVDRTIFLSHISSHIKNREFIISLLLDNSYPLKLIFDKINRRIKNKFVNKSKLFTENNSNNHNNQENKRQFI